MCHNPCFSGNSFATLFKIRTKGFKRVTILVLVETPLQLEKLKGNLEYHRVTILVLVETPLQHYILWWLVGCSWLSQSLF